MEGHFQHSYDYDGMASLKSEEEYEEEENEQERQAEYFRDEDAEYEDFVVKSFEELELSLEELVECFNNNTKSYYKNKREKILEVMKKYAIEQLEIIEKEQKEKLNGAGSNTNL
jgi:hypothetical protein